MSSVIFFNRLQLMFHALNLHLSDRVTARVTTTCYTVATITLMFSFTTASNRTPKFGTVLS